MPISIDRLVLMVVPCPARNPRIQSISFAVLANLCLLLLNVPCMGQSGSEEFGRLHAAWKGWYLQQLDDKVCFSGEFTDPSGQSASKTYVRDGRNQSAIVGESTFSGSHLFSAELVNQDYVASLESRLKGAWLLTDLIEKNSAHFRRLHGNVAAEFEAIMGGGLYYLEVPNVIETVSGFGTAKNWFEIKLRTTAFPTDDPAYKPMPSLMLVRFGEFGLPTDMRLHCTTGDFNFAVESKYERFDDRIRKVRYRTYTGFSSLNESLSTPDVDVRFGSFRNLEERDLVACRLTHYGLPEPKEEKFFKFSNTWILLAVLLPILCVLAILARNQKGRS